MIVNALTVWLSGWKAPFEKGRTDVDRRLLQRSGSRGYQNTPIPECFYELKIGEASKLHLTTSRVTSSSKLSPQKSAAAL